METLEPDGFRDEYGFPLDGDLVEFFAEYWRDAQHAVASREDSWNAALALHHIFLSGNDVPAGAEPQAKKSDQKKIRKELTRDETIHRLVKLGIPRQLRATLWGLLSGAAALRADHPSEYQRKLIEIDAGPNTEDARRAAREIEYDLDRTFPSHPLFSSTEGIERLARVLRAYSLRNPDIGYCQAMNFISALLLLHTDEENAFWILTTIVETHLPGFYSRTMVGLQIEQEVLDDVYRREFPELADHLACIGMHLPALVTQWYLCIFINALPWGTTCRIWDVFLVEGINTILRVALALLRRAEVGMRNTDDPGEAMKVLRHHERMAFDADALISEAFSLVDLEKYNLPAMRKHARAKVEQAAAESEKRREVLRQQRRGGASAQGARASSASSRLSSRLRNMFTSGESKSAEIWPASDSSYMQARIFRAFRATNDPGAPVKFEVSVAFGESRWTVLRSMDSFDQLATVTGKFAGVGIVCPELALPRLARGHSVRALRRQMRVLNRFLREMQASEELRASQEYCAFLLDDNSGSQAFDGYRTVVSDEEGLDNDDTDNERDNDGDAERSDTQSAGECLVRDLERALATAQEEIRRLRETVADLERENEVLRNERHECV